MQQRQIRFVPTDGDGGTSGTAQISVNVGAAARAFGSSVATLSTNAIPKNAEDIDLAFTASREWSEV